MTKSVGGRDYEYDSWDDSNDNEEDSWDNSDDDEDDSWDNSGEDEEDSLKKDPDWRQTPVSAKVTCGFLPESTSSSNFL